MRAVAVWKFGATPEVVDVPVPAAGRGEVLVRLAAAGMNPFDWKVAEGMMDGSMPHNFPLILGVDGAGVVDALGEGATRFAVGDAIYGQFFHAPVGTGTYAEYIAAPEELALARAPRNVPPSRAAAVPTAGMTALALVETLALADGQTVLIVGATGGVGSFATQLAAARGATVIATARGAESERMRALGAAETVDHSQGPVADQVRAAHPGGVDALIDLVSDAAGFTTLAGVVRPGGTAATTVFVADPDELARHDVRGLNFEVRTSPELLDRLSAEIDAGRLQIPVEAEVPLDGAPEAFTRLRAGRVRGKIVVVL